MNWNDWEGKAKVPEYDPPQLNNGWLNTCSCINWYGMRSPLCPLTTECIKCCICAENITLTDESTWVQPLMRSIHPNCPDEFKGIYWLRDHIQPTSLLTFHDCDWSDGKRSVRTLSNNWVKSNTMYGVLSSLSFFVGKLCFDMPFEISPSGKWIHVNFIGIRTYWMYMFTTDTTIIRKIDGQKIRVFKGDLMRIDYKDSKDPSSPIKYIYLIQRIIVPGKNGELIKRPSYYEFMKRVNVVNKEPYLRNESIIRHDTLKNEQHTLGFAKSF